MTDATADAAAWAALLPGAASWSTAGRPQSARRIGRAMAGLEPGQCLAIPASPWSFARAAGAAGAADPAAAAAYVAFPSRQRPVLVASRDAAVLRYVADSVLSVPPGAGQIPSMVLTAGLRLLRFPFIWNVAAIMRAAGLVVVGRRK
jgi:hypothetical protein